MYESKPKRDWSAAEQRAAAELAASTERINSGLTFRAGGRRFKSKAQNAAEARARKRRA